MTPERTSVAVPARDLATRHAIITGTGSAVPSRVITNDELSALLGEDITPFVTGTLGITTRHWCAASESTADLAEEAAHAALTAAGLTARDIDLLLVATDTPEYVSPATASVLHGRLELTGAGAFDINAGDAGFVTALDTAWKYLRADDRYRRVLVIGANAISRYLDSHDMQTVSRFADGAGAVVLEASETAGVLAAELFADGRLCHAMGVFAGGTRTPITQTVLDAGLHTKLRIVQQHPASVSEEGWPRLVQSVLDRAGRTPDEVSLWLWPQADRRTIESVMERLGQPMERAHTIMHKWGDTGSASLPMALDDAVRAGRLADGDLVVFTGSGAGLAMGSLAMTWRARNAPVHP